MSRPKLTEDSRTAERLLDAAEQEFAAVGYASARLADIAASAGIRRPSLLYHFESKERLYSAVVARVFGSLGEALTRPMNGAGKFDSQFAAVIRAFEHFLRERPSLAPIIVRELIDDPNHGAAVDAARRGGAVGHAILLERVVPLLGTVETFVRSRGGDRLRPGLPVRAAVVQLAANLLLCSASGDLAKPLWGRDAHALRLARMLFFRDPMTETEEGDKTR